MNAKKILSLVFAGVIMVGAVMSFSSCKLFKKGEEEHEHTYAEAWSTDANNHWHDATCEHNTEKKDVAAHVDANGDEKCDACAYAMPVQKEEESTNKPNDGAESKPEEPALTSKTTVTFNVVVVNSAGEGVAGVSVVLIDKEGKSYGDSIWGVPTDADGKVSFTTLYKSGWLAQVVATPEGYTYETRYDEDTGFDYVVMYEFDENFNVTITLLDDPINQEPEQTPEENPEQTPEVTE